MRLALHAADSLKDKRRVRQSVVARTRRRYNVAVSEIDDQDAWGTLTLGIACVSTDAGHAHAMLEKVVDSIERDRLDADLVDYEIEML